MASHSLHRVSTNHTQLGFLGQDPANLAAETGIDCVTSNTIPLEHSLPISLPAKILHLRDKTRLASSIKPSQITPAHWALPLESHRQVSPGPPMQTLNTPFCAIVHYVIYAFLAHRDDEALEGMSSVSDFLLLL